MAARDTSARARAGVGPTIRVLYSCHGCGADKEAVLVRERGASEQVVPYVRDVIGAAVSKAHRLRHPGCRAEQCDLMVPVHGVARLGEVTRH